MKTEDLTYIDWNLFSILKEPKLNPHIILNDFLKKNSEKITLVYSDAHLGDLAQTSEGLSGIRNNDLKYLSERTKDLVIVKYFGRDYADPYIIYKTNKYFYRNRYTGLLINNI